MEYGATVWDPYQKYNSDTVERVQCRELQCSLKVRYTRYSSVSDILDELGWPCHLFLKGDSEARLILFYNIINGLRTTKLLTVGHNCSSKASLLRRIRVLEESITWNLDRLAIQLASMDSRFFLKLLVHGTGLLSLKLCHWLYLDKILVKISVHPFHIIP